VQVVGVYAVVQQVLRTLRSLRTAFEPAVIAVAARAHSDASDSPDLAVRAKEAVSRASRYVAGAQWSIVVVLAIAGRPILGFFGEGFEVGATAAIAGSAMLAIAGPLAVAGAALIGLGDVRSQPIATAVALVTNGALLAALVPAFPLEGAAIACGAAAIAQGLALRLRFEGTVDRIAALREA
jgi:O-antigen/teichoic acid export membrane protein